jgi:hypothetical protein
VRERRERGGKVFFIISEKAYKTLFFPCFGPEDCTSEQRESPIIQPKKRRKRARDAPEKGLRIPKNIYHLTARDTTEKESRKRVYD